MKFHLNSRRKNKSQRHILVFDFDGTIADTFEFSLKMNNSLALEFNFKTVQPHEVEIMKDKSIHDFIQHVGVPVIKIPIIMMRVRNALKKEITNIEPAKGLKAALLALKPFGYEIGIITTNSAENVMKFLKHHSIDIFDFIKTTSLLTGKHKCLQNLMKNKRVKPDQVIYIGDETRDIEAAKKAAVKVIAVSWGYNSSRILKAHRPDHLIHDPKELIALCQNLFKFSPA